MVLGAMELSSSSPTPTNTTKNTPIQIPNPNQNLNPTIKSPFQFTNGLKQHPLPPPPPPSSPPSVTYRECLKNHAAAIGGHALDGCGEFMPSPGPVPASLKCAACGCHRNFHRRDAPPGGAGTHAHAHLHLRLSPPQRPSPSPSPGRSSSPGPTPSPTPSPHSPPPLSHLPPNSFFASPAPAQAHMLLALGGERSHSQAHAHARKRFRTKFSPEQKERMCAFAERLGWRMQRGEERLVEEFCGEIGVRKGVLKVWMHNNKHTLGKRDRTLGGNNNNGDHSGVNGGGAGSSNTNTANGGDGDGDDDDDSEHGRPRE